MTKVQFAFKENLREMWLIRLTTVITPIDLTLVRDRNGKDEATLTVIATDALVTTGYCYTERYLVNKNPLLW